MDDDVKKAVDKTIHTTMVHCTYLLEIQTAHFLSNGARLLTGSNIETQTHKKWGFLRGGDSSISKTQLISIQLQANLYRLLRVMQLTCRLLVQNVRKD